jgi:hypothetical protein
VLKSWISSYILSDEFQGSPSGRILRGFIQRTRSLYSYSPWFLLDTQAIERPHYAYCMLHAARLAQKLGLSSISAIEFGVAGGNGLAFMVKLAGHVKTATNVTVECYGFDTALGMPDPEGPKDLPYWFRAAQYPMDHAALRRKVPDAKLVIGKVRDTIGTFVEKYRPAPIGAIFNDVDYWSSTLDTFRLFDRVGEQSDHFLPRIMMYFDDVIGSEAEMYGPANGQLAAIREFNATRHDAAIYLNQNLLPRSHINYRYQIYYAHLFSHIRYSTFLGDSQQGGIFDALRLQA